MDSPLLHPEEVQFRNEGPWSKFTVDLVVPFYNEEANLAQTHLVNQRLERLFNVGHYLYVNNGSKDGTEAGLNKLALENPKVQVVHVPVNQGYGYGMKQGIKAATADFVLTNHADVQFDSYTFFLTHLPLLIRLGGPSPIFPIRANRPRTDAFVSACLRVLCRIFLRRKIDDFNGQPKLMPRDRIQPGADNFENDFALDICLYLRFKPEEIVQLPVLQAARLHGESSWNRGPFARVNQAKRWFKVMWKLRKVPKP